MGPDRAMEGDECPPVNESVFRRARDHRDSLAAPSSTAPRSLPSPSISARASSSRHPRACAATGGGPRAHRRCPRRVREAIHPAGAAGWRGLRRSVSAGHGARPPRCWRSASSRSPAWKAPGDRARMHRHPQRSGATVVYPCARSDAQDHRRGAGVEHDARPRRSSTRAPERVRARRSRGPATASTPISGAARLRRGGLEDAWVEPPEEIYTLTRSPQESRPGRPTSSSISRPACRCGPTAWTCRSSS